MLISSFIDIVEKYFHALPTWPATSGLIQESNHTGKTISTSAKCHVHRHVLSLGVCVCMLKRCVFVFSFRLSCNKGRDNPAATWWLIVIILSHPLPASLHLTSSLWTHAIQNYTGKLSSSQESELHNSSQAITLWHSVFPGRQRDGEMQLVC